MINIGKGALSLLIGMATGFAIVTCYDALKNAGLIGKPKEDKE